MIIFLSIILIFLIIVLIAYHLFASKCLEAITHPVRYTPQDLEKRDTGNGFGSCYQQFRQVWHKDSFTLPVDDAVLQGNWIYQDHPVNKVVLICHGHTVNRYADLKYAEIFYQLGYEVVIFDERYFGESSGNYCTLGQNEAKDIAALVRYIRSKKGPNVHIGLHGESMGAAAVLLSLQYEPVDFVIADCPFANTLRLAKEIVKRSMPWLPVRPLLKEVIRLANKKYAYDIAHANPIDVVRKTDTPILFIHGTSDKLIDCSHSQDMYAVCKNPDSEIQLFSSADHACSIVTDPARYARVVQSFIGKLNQK